MVPSKFPSSVASLEAGECIDGWRFSGVDDRSAAADGWGMDEGDDAGNAVVGGGDGQGRGMRSVDSAMWGGCVHRSCAVLLRLRDCSYAVGGVDSAHQDVIVEGIWRRGGRGLFVAWEGADMVVWGR